MGKKLNELLAQGKIKPIVEKELPLEKLAEAHELIRDSSKGAYGKIVIKID